MSSYASTEQDTLPREQLSAHEVLCPGYYSHDLSNRDILLQKALFLSQFLRYARTLPSLHLSATSSLHCHRQATLIVGCSALCVWHTVLAASL